MVALRKLTQEELEIGRGKIMPSPFGSELVSHLPAMKSYALSLCRGDASTADDIVQDAAESAFASQRTFEPGSNMKSWLFTIVKNAAFRHFQKSRNTRHDLSLDEDMIVDMPSHEGNQDSSQLLREIDVILNRMPREQRDVLLTVCVNGLTMDEAADVLGVESGTVKSRLHRGRERLLSEMNATGVALSDVVTQEASTPKSKRGRKARTRTPGTLRKLSQARAGRNAFEFVVDCPQDQSTLTKTA